ncbi:MAG: hypothetical protein PVF37_11205 [Desulfobacterales bacterium]|jgi:hypothetical protein
MVIGCKKLFLTVLIMSIFVSTSHGKVVIFDRATTVLMPIHITVQTRDGFFVSGGQLVDIYLDSTFIKKILTGGDGYGYLKYIPREPGLKKITARMNAESASGRILVVKQNERVVLIETEGAFKDSVFSDEARRRSQEAVKSISKKYRIIYLSRLLGAGITESWLEKYAFPESVILRWDGPNILDKLKKNGLQLLAIIGSPNVISAAADKIERRFSFEKTKDGKTVKNWEEILDFLLKSPSSDLEKKKIPARGE